MSSRRLVGALCAVAFLAGACTSSGAQPNDDPTTASPTAEATATPTPSATTSSPSDPFAMPDPVTDEYVDRVVNAIYEEWGAITREILEQPADPTAITPVETRERIAALFGGEYLQRTLEEADDILRGDRGGLLPPSEFTSIQWTTRRLFAATEHCLVAAGDFDLAGTATSGDRVLTTVSLSPTSGNGNETGWRIVDAQSNTGPGGEVLEDDVMLEASLDDFGSILTTTCEDPA